MSQTWENGKNLVSDPILAHLTQIQAAKSFFKNLTKIVTRYHGQLSPCRISEKTYNPILRKLCDGRTDGQPTGPEWFRASKNKKHYFLPLFYQKIKTSNLKGHTWDWEYIICKFKFLQLSAYRINFSVYFLVQLIHIKRIFEMVSHFFLLLCGFWEISKYLVPKVVVIHILKERMIYEDLQTIRKKANTIYRSAFIWVLCTTKNFKAIL